MMVLVLTIAGLVALTAGLLAVVAGLPIMEFSYGNTLIMSGAIGAGCGLIVVGLAQILRELRRQTSAHHFAGATRADFAHPVPPAAAMPQAEASFAAQSHATAAGADTTHDKTSWQDAASPRSEVRRAKADGSHDMPGGRVSPRVVTPSPRNLMFRRPAHPSAQEADLEPRGATVPDPGAQAELDHETAPMSPPQRVEGLWKRRRKEPTGTPEPSPTLDLSRAEPPAESATTILKSGTVDGLAYTLYSDGSIEAQLPEGTMRFDSIEALRVYLDRPV